MPRHFWRMVLAELRKILTRPSGVAGLMVAALVGVGAPLFLYGVEHQISGPLLAEPGVVPTASWTHPDLVFGLGAALIARNFFVLPLILLMVGAELLAGEWADRTLSALLVRPVSRASVLWAKLSATLAYASASLILTFLAAAGTGLALMGVPQDMGRLGEVALGYLACGLSDLGLISVCMLVSTFSRSVVGVVVGTILVMMLDLAVRGVLKVLGALKVADTEPIASLMPGRALSVWEGWSGTWDAGAFVGLAVLIVVCAGGATWRFVRGDVP